MILYIRLCHEHEAERHQDRSAAETDQSHYVTEILFKPGSGDIYQSKGDEEAPETEEPEPTEIPIEELIARLSFVDNSDIADYAIEAVARMTAGGILDGNDEGAFLPRKNSTRAETAVMIYRIMMDQSNK